MKTSIQDPDSKPAGSANALERGSYPAPGEDTEGGGAHPARTMPTPSKESAGGRNVASGKGTMGEGRGSSGKYSGIIGGGDTTKCKGVMGN